jgi:lipopolysaccharide/colanic/teichoic acid biosynthesis glycosyltransferase
MYQEHVKRPLDVVAACLVLVLTAPVLFLIAVAVRVRLGSPVLSFRCGLDCTSSLSGS